MTDNPKFPYATLTLTAANPFQDLDEMKKHLNGPLYARLVYDLIMGLADINNHAYILDDSPNGIREFRSIHLDNYPLSVTEKELTEEKGHLWVNVSELLAYLRDIMSELNLPKEE